MSSPVPPSDFKDLIPNVDTDLCDKFVRFLREFPKKYYLWYSSVYTEEGDFTEDYKDMLCAACPCDGTDSGGGTGTGLRTPVIMASDGTYNDKVRVTWSEVASASNYDVYRSLTNNVAGSTLVGSVVTGLYDDLTVAAGTTYYYWVKARNSMTESAFSGGDPGYASVVLSVTTTLKASQGIYSVSLAKPFIALVWVPVAGATAYDIYRGTTTVFADAILIDTNRTPYDNSETTRYCAIEPCVGNIFVHRSDELLYLDETATSKLTPYYYWVKAKQLSGAQVIGVSAESNVATGWSGGKGVAGFVTNGSLTFSDETYTIPGGITSLWLAVHGGGAAGGGGNAGAGGGGGGAGAIVAGLLTVEAGRRIKFVSTPATAAEGFAVADGDDGPVTKLQYETGVASGAYTDIITCAAPVGGKFTGGLGGAGGTFTVHASLTQTWSEPGRAGLVAVGNKGGRGGATFDLPRRPGNNLNGIPTQPFAAGTGYGSAGNGGGGSWAVPASGVLAKGGEAAIGSVEFVAYA